MEADFVPDDNQNYWLINVHRVKYTQQIVQRKDEQRVRHAGHLIDD